MHSDGSGGDTSEGSLTVPQQNAGINYCVAAAFDKVGCSREYIGVRVDGQCFCVTDECESKGSSVSNKQMFRFQGGKCTQCPDGWVQPTQKSSRCLACLKGKYSKGDPPRILPCTQCAKGRYTKNDHETSCSLCPGGTFASAVESAMCTACGAGKYTDEWAMKVCTCGDEFAPAFCTNAQLLADSTGCEDVTFTASEPASCTNGQLLADSSDCETVTFTPVDPEDTTVAASCDNGGALNTDSDGCEPTLYIPETPAACDNGGLINAGSNGCLATVFVSASCGNDGTLNAGTEGCKADSASDPELTLTSIDVTDCKSCDAGKFLPQDGGDVEEWHGNKHDEEEDCSTINCEMCCLYFMSYIY